VWTGLDDLISKNRLISTREVWRELQQGNPTPHVNDWLNQRKHIFTTPTNEELNFVATIFSIKHFQQLIGKQQQLRGTAVADPFVIACAAVRKKGIVVCEESRKENSARMPNVCDHFKIPCIKLKEFMQQQNWTF
jgi:hypothetical protein